MSAYFWGGFLPKGLITMGCPVSPTACAASHHLAFRRLTLLAIPTLPHQAMERNSKSAGAEDISLNLPSKPENENEGNQLHSEDRDEAEAQATEQWSLAAKMQQVKNYLWDPEKREFLGRSGQSWSLILLFYLFFYAFLAGMFTLCMYTMLLTISPYIPIYRDRVSPPGVMIRPYTYSFVFNFNASERSTWISYVDSLHHFLQPYNDSVQDEKNLNCPPGQYFLQEGAEDKEKKACQFKRSFLGNCSGLDDPTFGYSTGQPCVLLKMNRIVGFQPGSGEPVKVNCHVQKGNKSDLKSMEFYPEAGTFDLSYYPYYGKLTHVNYTSPLVAVHFTEVKKNRAVGVECQLKGKNIANNITNDRFLGRVIFTLNIGG
ncbi:protein ATP1B4 isoform X1 [Macrotis lagotis]|uniref:protein ATP1B4 isoform X1 n=1 Tax=Macrotis lagotis TaxID=92651 RepID=UPI003D6893E4